MHTMDCSISCFILKTMGLVLMSENVIAPLSALCTRMVYEQIDIFRDHSILQQTLGVSKQPKHFISFLQEHYENIKRS